MDYRALLKALLQDYDPSLDLSDDAPITTDVIDKFMRALDHDPFVTNISKFIRTRVEQETGMHIADGTALDDVLDKSAQAVFEPLRREINRISQRQSLYNADIMTDQELEDLAINRFVIRDTGTYAQVRVRIYFVRPVDLEILPDNIARTNDGLGFLPISRQTITSSAMEANKEGAYYYMDALFIAEEEGSEYSVAANTITTVEGISAIRVTNLAGASVADDRTSNEQLIVQAQDAQSQKTLVTKRGSNHTLWTEFGSQLRLLLPIGRNEPEMERDIISSDGDRRAEVTSRVITPPNVTVDATHNALKIETDNAEFTIILANGVYDTMGLSDAINLAWVTAGGLNYIAEPYQDGVVKGVTFHSDTNNRGTDSFITLKTVANNLLSLFTGHTLNLPYYGDLSGVLSLDSIPGGIIDPDTPNGKIIVPSNQIHIGAGATDYYVASATVIEETYAIDNAEHYNPDAISTYLTTTLGDDWVSITDATEYAAIQLDDIMAIYEGADAGLYRVLDKDDLTTSVRLDATMAATAPNIPHAIVSPSTLEVKILTPGQVFLHANDLSTLAGSDGCTITHNTTTYGVVLGSIVEILSGNDIGSYKIVELLGTLSFRLDAQLTTTATGVEYRIRDAAPVFLLPMRELTEIQTMLAGSTSGILLPYAYPIDIRVGDLTNIGKGVLVDGTETGGPRLDTAASSNLITSTAASFNDAGVTVGDRLIIYEGLDAGEYRVEAVVSPIVLCINAHLTDTAVNLKYKVGTPSTGTARLYFPLPTSFEAFASEDVCYYGVGYTFEQGTRFYYEDSVTGNKLYYEPGYLNGIQRVPAIGDAYPADLNKVGILDNEVQSLSTDFNACGVKPGDRLYITTGAMAGGPYTIMDVDRNNLLCLGTPFTGAVTNDSFYVVDATAQGMHTYTMSQQGKDGPFYYVDIEIVSVAPGDEYNLPARSKLKVDRSTRHYREGWWLGAENDKLTYTMYEEPLLYLTPYFLEDGLPPSRPNRTMVHGTGLQIKYNRPEAIQSVQNFVTQTMHRNICQDPLVRHFFPAFIYLEIAYAGGASEEDMRLALKTFIENLDPEEYLTAYDIEKLFRKKSATNVPNPIDIVAIHWKKDREISVDRSYDRVLVDRTTCYLVFNNLAGVTKVI